MIKLTSHRNKLPMLINELSIICVESEYNGNIYITRIHTLTGASFHVKETVEEVEELLKQ